MAKDSITISPKHGLNPALIKCFWCGEDMGIALCGKLKGDEKAPNSMIADYEPCDKCKEGFAHGILAIGVQYTPAGEGFPPICNDEKGTPMYPDGSHIVLTEQGLRRILDDQVMIDKILKRKAAFFEADFVHRMVEDAQKIIEEEKKKHENSSGRIPSH